MEKEPMTRDCPYLTPEALAIRALIDQLLSLKGEMKPKELEESPN